MAFPWGSLLSLTGFLFPQYENNLFLINQPALMGEIALVLWLLIKGATPPTYDD